MTQFTIRDIENLTGIKAHTLRIWEQRYGFFKSQRKESQHRFYDNEDLKQLLRIAFLYQQGYKVSKIAAMNAEEVIREVSTAKVSTENFTPFINRLMEAAIDFDEFLFRAVLDEVQSAVGFERLIIEVCYPYLKKVGLLWTTNHLIPAQEHFATNIIQQHIITATDKLPRVNNKPEIMLVAPQGEFHELPLLFIQYLLRESGWAVLYLGTNIKGEELLQMQQLSSLRYLYLHLITNFTGMFVDDYLEQVSKQFSKVSIVASGEGIRHAQRSFVNLKLLKTDAEILQFIRSKTLAEHNP